ncbi:MAG: hypothetical protein H6747_06740 [Deltaproteobacteria bacterium]|nr:hypothetical protein [Deltaproteobacteria bacterium]
MRAIEVTKQQFRRVAERKRALDAAWQGPPMAERAPTLPPLVVQLRGDQRAMGEQHGELLRGEGGFEQILDYYPGMAERMVAGAHAHPAQLGVPLLLGGVSEALLARLERRRPAALRERSRRFYQALGRPEEDATFLGVMDLLQNVIGVAGKLRVPAVGRRWSALVPGACSTLAVWGPASADGELLLGRNFDFPGTGVWESAPVIAFATPTEGLRYGFVTTRGADAPCVSVWNEAGLCITIHTRFHQDVRWDGRLAVDLVHEMIRRAATIDEAVAIAREAAVASSWGIVVASGIERRAVLVELTAKAVTVTHANPGEPFLACTNRYQSSALQSGELEPSMGWIMHSDGRHMALRRQALRGLGGEGLSAEAIATLLGSHEDPEVEGSLRAAGGVLAQSNGVHSVVIDPIGQRTLVSVGAVPTGHGPWISVPWRWDDAPSVRSLEVGELRATFAADPNAPGAAFRHGDRGRAYAHLLEAARLEASAGPAVRVQDAIDAAVHLDPTEASYRLLAGGFALTRGHWQTAEAQFEAGLASEKGPFGRARLLHFAALAAEGAGQRRRAEALRRELAGVHHPRVAPYQRAATRRVDPRSVTVGVQLCDVSL